MEKKPMEWKRVSEYFIRIVIMFTTFLVLLFLSDYYNKLELFFIDLLYLVAMMVYGIAIIVKKK